MNITENIQRIMGGKSDIKSLAQKKNIEIPQSVKIDRYADYIGQNWPDVTIGVTYDGTKIRGSTKKWNQKVTRPSFRNISLDTRTYLQFQLFGQTSIAAVFTYNFSEPANLIKIIDIPSTQLYRIKHNGVSNDITIDQDIPLQQGHKILLLVSAIGIDPRMLGGINLPNIAIIDMTDNYGEGNEPTSESDERVRELIDYEKAHPEYNKGGIVFGYYKGIKLGQLDYIDKSSNILHIGGEAIDLGSLSYEIIEYSDIRMFRSINQLPNRPFQSGTVDFICGFLIPRRSRGDLNIDYSISPYNATNVNSVCIRIDEAESVDDFQSIIDGVLLYYELANPIEIDLS